MAAVETSTPLPGAPFDPHVGARGILTCEFKYRGLFGSGVFTGRIAYTVVEVLGQSARIEVESVSGLPRSLRKRAREMMEGWHPFSELIPATA